MMRMRFAFRAMACDNAIELFADSEADAAAVAASAIAEVRRIETKYSRYRPESVVSRINAAAGGAPVVVDAETAALLNLAEAAFDGSDGLFDITSGILRRVWNFQAVTPPRDEELAPLLPLIGWQKIERSTEQGVDAIRLPLPGMEIDFGGFGKEYAADRAASVLMDAGMRHAFVNLGGDVVVAGPQADGNPWQLGVRHPRRAGEIIASLPILSGAVATSGDYERYIECDGRRYSHLLDPRTGRAVQGLQSVTVLAPVCTGAGLLSTTAMLKGTDGCDWLARSATPGVSAFVVDERGQTHRYPS